MKKAKTIRDFDYYIDEYMYHCRSRKLRPKTMSSYEQTLRLFERWCLEEAEITQPSQVLDTQFFTSIWIDCGRNWREL